MPPLPSRGFSPETVARYGLQLDAADLMKLAGELEELENAAEELERRGQHSEAAAVRKAAEDRASARAV